MRTKIDYKQMEALANTVLPNKPFAEYTAKETRLYSKVMRARSVIAKAIADGKLQNEKADIVKNRLKLVNRISELPSLEVVVPFGKGTVNLTLEQAIKADTRLPLTIAGRFGEAEEVRNITVGWTSFKFDQVAKCVTKLEKLMRGESVEDLDAEEQAEEQAAANAPEVVDTIPEAPEAPEVEDTAPEAPEVVGKGRQGGKKNRKSKKDKALA